eukprot:15443193-Alexandrium_andersonii.AAC.1
MAYRAQLLLHVSCVKQQPLWLHALTAFHENVDSAQDILLIRVGDLWKNHTRALRMTLPTPAYIILCALLLQTTKQQQAYTSLHFSTPGKRPPITSTVDIDCSCTQ